MNYMEDVAQMLGVEMNEYFYVDGINLGCADAKFYINDKGLFQVLGGKPDTPWPLILGKIISGDAQIVKIPKTKHTGLEPIRRGKTYDLFKQSCGIVTKDFDKLNPQSFSDKTIRDSWERYITIKRSLAEAAARLNTAPIDWDDCRQEKWFICCRDHETLTCHYIDCGADEGVFFTSQEAARQAIEIVGEKDLIWMLRDFQPYIGYSKEQI